MYGLARTFIKVKSSLHMKNSESFDGDVWINPKSKGAGDVAIIGCGNFSFSTIAYYLSKSTRAKIKYALDIDKSKSRSLIGYYSGYAAVTNVETILADSDVRLVFIASNHASHAEYAIQAINAGKHVQIEKPHAVTLDQLERLRIAMQNNPGSKVFLGFNRPRSKLFNRLKSSMDAQSGTASFNWFVAGHEIDDAHWYHAKKEGGRIMGNLCHWSDLSLHLVGLDNSFPCVITPAELPQSNSNFCVALSFSDGSNASITFSAKEDPFEGVREILIAHKGALLGVLKDFYELSLDIGPSKKKISPLFRDHGHEENILNTYKNSISDSGASESIDYVYATGLLVLKIKEAVENGEKVICQPEFRINS